jgi:hypothetical protein
LVLKPPRAIDETTIHAYQMQVLRTTPWIESQLRVMSLC